MVAGPVGFLRAPPQAFLGHYGKNSRYVRRRQLKGGIPGAASAVVVCGDVPVALSGKGCFLRFYVPGELRKKKEKKLLRIPNPLSTGILKRKRDSSFEGWTMRKFSRGENVFEMNEIILLSDDCVLFWRSGGLGIRLYPIILWLLGKQSPAVCDLIGKTVKPGLP